MDISKFCIPMLDGPNWGQWYKQFATNASAQIINIWDTIRGDILTPAPNLTWDLLVKPSPPTGTPTAAKLATYNAAKTLWGQKNLQGLGLIQATISNVIWQKYESLSTVKEVLDALETKFRAVGGHRPTSSWTIWWKFNSPIQRIYCHRSNNFRIIITW